MAVLLEDAVWRADAEATAPAIAEEDVANDLFVVPVDEGGARGGENAAVAARALRAALREQTTARHSLERERESLVEREKLLSKQISRAKRRLERLDRMVRDAEALHQALAALGAPPPAPLLAHDDHSTDALITAAWLRDAARDAKLWHALWHPPMLDDAIRRTEGWTFGVK